jgi:hypothetical protein
MMDGERPEQRDQGAEEEHEEYVEEGAQQADEAHQQAEEQQEQGESKLWCVKSEELIGNGISANDLRKLEIQGFGSVESIARAHRLVLCLQAFIFKACII